MKGMNEMCNKLEEYSLAEISKERNQINTKELGEVVDMMKDLSEVKKNKAEADYYCALTEAMEDAEYGIDYDFEGPIRKGYGTRGMRRGYSNNNMMPMDDYRMTQDGRIYGYNRNTNQGRQGSSMGSGMTSRGNSRYGFSHDEYMEAKDKYSMNDPEGRQKRMEALDDYLDDLSDSAKEMIANMTPEEKQVWKTKTSRLINM